jgi:uncharacterized membrane protein YhaH (DUF805 family)
VVLELQMSESMTVTAAVSKGFRNVFRIVGRSPRDEFVPFAIFIVFLWILVYVGQQVTFFWLFRAVDLGGNLKEMADDISIVFLCSYGVFLLLLALLFSAMVRRLHDIDYSARWAIAAFVIPVLLVMVPFGVVMAKVDILPSGIWHYVRSNILHASGYFVGNTVFLIAVFNLLVVVLFCFRPSQPGPNRYGPNPNEVSP